MVFIGGTEGRDVFTVLLTRFGEKEHGYSIVMVVTVTPFCMTVTPTQHKSPGTKPTIGVLPNYL